MLLLDKLLLLDLTLDESCLLSAELLLPRPSCCCHGMLRLLRVKEQLVLLLHLLLLDVVLDQAGLLPLERLLPRHHHLHRLLLRSCPPQQLLLDFVLESLLLVSLLLLNKLRLLQGKLLLLNLMRDFQLLLLLLLFNQLLLLFGKLFLIDSKLLLVVQSSAQSLFNMRRRRGLHSSLELGHFHLHIIVIIVFIVFIISNKSNRNLVIFIHVVITDRSYLY